MTTAAVYARKSSDDSAKNDEARSTARQIARATEYATAKGWTVDPRYIYVDDAVSGAEWKHRPGFNALLAALEPRPPFDVLIVSELSRIGRDTVRTPAAVLQIEEAGVSIYGYLSNAPITLGDETGEMTTMLHSLGASFERRRARARTYDALRRRAEAGAVTGGKVYGYRNARKGTGYVQRVIDDGEAATVRRIFVDYSRGLGLVRIAKRLNAEGIRPPRARGWAPSAIREMLYRPLYRGEVVWGKSQKTMRRGTKGQRRRDAAEWLRREVPELAIVSPELAAAVDARLSTATSTFRRAAGGRLTGGAVQAPGYASLYLLTNFARCSECGGPIGTITRTHGSGGKRFPARFYGCTTRDRRGPATCANSTLLRHEILDAAFLDAIRAKVEDDLIRDAVTRAVDLRRARQSATLERTPAIEREIQAVDQRITRLVDAVAIGGPVEELVERLKAERARKAALVDELRSLNAHGGDPNTGDLTSRLFARAAELRRLLGVHVGRTRQILTAMLAGPVAMVPVIEDGRRGYRFTGRLRLGGLLAGDGTETRHAVVAPTGFEPVFELFKT
jgi:site-specific DNA recombinase